MLVLDSIEWSVSQSAEFKPLPKRIWGIGNKARITLTRNEKTVLPSILFSFFW